MGYVSLFGDFNARTGIQSDFIKADDDKHLPLNDDYIEDTSIHERCSQDYKNGYWTFVYLLDLEYLIGERLGRVTGISRV